MVKTPSTGRPGRQERRRYLPAVGPGLNRLLVIILGLVALLGVNSVYLLSITVLEGLTGRTWQNYFYQYMFLFHLVLGLLIVVPFVVFSLLHIRNAYRRPNRRAVRAGFALFAAALALLGTGLVLTRLEGILEVRDPAVRTAAYWIHILSPLAVAWLFVLHRLAGPRLRWRTGAAWAAVAAGFALVMTLLHSQDPRLWNVATPKSGEKYFFPSLARTASGNFIPERVLTNDGYCKQCHADIHRGWSSSMHRFSSFNNPAYLFSVRETRRVLHDRDGDVRGARFCAGCHDQVPFFSGAFDEPHFDNPDYDLASDPAANAGITCTVCHAITTLNSPRGNGDYVIEEPIHYPFTFSDNRFLMWVNRQLVKGKPEFHKRTFLKELHRSPEFCATCHKVHLPEEVNAYKWLRGQNHFDSYTLSGVSGHGVASFYYPPTAVHQCSACHMPLAPSDDFGASDFDGSGRLQVHDHQFVAANTGVPPLVGMPDEIIDTYRDFLDGVMRIDLFGVKEGGTIDGRLHAPLRPGLPPLRPGRRYLAETVIRTVKMGHLFTEGTSDSNEIWLEMRVTNGGRVIGRSGGRDADGTVDPWSHFVNTFMLDRDGYRIDRRNAQDIFIPLYTHQIPPGAADVVHYLLEVPADAAGTVEIDARLLYRKFDTTYVRLFQGEAFRGNDLPVIELARDRVVLPVAGSETAAAPIETRESVIPEWERWNDYGIGLLRKGSRDSRKGELRQAEAAFREVERLGRPDGPLNLTRVYFKEGRLDEAAAVLERAAGHDPPAPLWSVLWFTGQVNYQNGYLDEAIDNFRTLVELDTAETRRREFDFSRDYRLLNELGKTLFERSKQERGQSRRAEREVFLREAAEWFRRALEYDPENVTAHYNLGLIYGRLGDEDRAGQHRRLHAKYKPDDNARDRAVTAARLRYPAANHAAEAIVIHDLHRTGAFEIPDAPLEMARDGR